MAENPKQPTVGEPETADQWLTPVETSYREIVRGGWPFFTRADIIGAHTPGSLLSKGIVAAESMILGHDAEISHVMRYLGRGWVLDQQDKLEVRGLDAYVGSIIRIYHHPAYTEIQRNALVANSMVWMGAPYDYKAIGAHAVEAFFGLDRLAEIFHDEEGRDCSEGICYSERLVMAYFMYGRSCQVMPAEIDRYCIEAEWEIRTLALVK